MSKQPVRKLDLLKACNDRDLPTTVFKGTFCRSCSNAKCVNAGRPGEISEIQ